MPATSLTTVPLPLRLTVKTGLALKVAVTLLTAVRVTVQLAVPVLQHRGHVLLSAGHSIAVQNFNEQLNILLMVAMYTLMLWLGLDINIIIAIFGILVSLLMLVILFWCRLNIRRDPELLDQIGQDGHGTAL